MTLIAYWCFENTTIKCLNNFPWKFLGNFLQKTGSGMCQCQSVVPVMKRVQNGEVVGASFDVWRFAQEHDQSAARFSLLPRPTINPPRMWHIQRLRATVFVCGKFSHKFAQNVSSSTLTIAIHKAKYQNSVDVFVHDHHFNTSSPFIYTRLRVEPKAREREFKKKNQNEKYFLMLFIFFLGLTRKSVIVRSTNSKHTKNIYAEIKDSLFFSLLWEIEFLILITVWLNQIIASRFGWTQQEKKYESRNW